MRHVPSQNKAGYICQEWGSRRGLENKVDAVCDECEKMERGMNRGYNIMAWSMLIESLVAVILYEGMEKRTNMRRNKKKKACGVAVMGAAYEKSTSDEVRMWLKAINKAIGF